MEMFNLFIVFTLQFHPILAATSEFGQREKNGDDHRQIPYTFNYEDHLQPEGSDYWFNLAMQSIISKQNEFRNEQIAKNIIMFVGDGMSVATITAARMLKGKLENLRFTEDGVLSLDNFPYTGISKTYCSNAQVADSACSATAYFSGIKNNIGMIGLKSNVTFRDCKAQMQPENHVSSILDWARAAGKSTGIVTTTRVTHATPAGTYAYAADRNWEHDKILLSTGGDSYYCDDIAKQLILNDPGRHIDVILGGGRLNFMPMNETDPASGEKGHRLDGQNLIKIWQQHHPYGQYVRTRDQLLSVDTEMTKSLLGLFAPSHMGFVHEQDAKNQPSLAQMTKVAIEILSKNTNGYFLLVEGGKIDMAHHNGNAKLALYETLEMDKAVKISQKMVNNLDTATLVTSDHSHTMTISGYPQRGHSIFGFAGVSDVDRIPYTTLSYANGQGYRIPVNGHRVNISLDHVEDTNYAQVATLPLTQESHGGDDVLMFANGPFAHYFSGVHQQSEIPYILAHAACIGPGLHNPQCFKFNENRNYNFK